MRGYFSREEIARERSEASIEQHARAKSVALPREVAEVGPITFSVRSTASSGVVGGVGSVSPEGGAGVRSGAPLVEGGGSNIGYIASVRCRSGLVAMPEGGGETRSVLLRQRAQQAGRFAPRKTGAALLRREEEERINRGLCWQRVWAQDGSFCRD